MTYAEEWQAERQRHLKVLPEILKTELRDLNAAKAATLLKVEKIEKRRLAAIVRLRESRKER